MALEGVPAASASLWIPAFAGMTGVESGNVNAPQPLTTNH